jgi:histidinol dehydrogenase
MIEKQVKMLKKSDRHFESELNLLLNKDDDSKLNMFKTVFEIINNIRKSGDKALLELVKKLDGIETDKVENLRVSKSKLKLAYNNLQKDQQQALNFAAKRISSFHKKQIPKNFNYSDDLDVKLGLLYTPIESVGFYVPGGKALYPSSVLMNAIPALIAGVKRRVMVTPISDLKKSSIVLAAAHVAGVTDFFCMGGAHSIAALAYGTETIEAVNKIVGPGNAYVAEAKRQVFGTVGIDSIAGPSEVLIVCDDTACSDHIAIDLLSQAEHDEQAQAILITDSIEFAKKVEVSVKKFLEDIPRSKIASTSWYNKGALIVVENMDEAIELINFIAPEHLELAFNNAEKYIDKIKNAGAIFIGLNTPEAVGDYVAGPNHVLPTNGTAKFSSGLSVLDFYKRTTVVKCNKKNLAIIGKHAVTLAKAEGLDAHAMSISLRIDK